MCEKMDNGSSISQRRIVSEVVRTTHAGISRFGLLMAGTTCLGLTGTVSHDRGQYQVRF